MPDITANSTEFQSVNTLTGIAVGAEMALQLKGTSWCYLVESSTQPADDSTEGVILTNLSFSYGVGSVDAGSDEIWIRCSQSGRTSVLNVQEI